MSNAIESGWSKMDTDKNGKVSREELHAHISSLEEQNNLQFQAKFNKASDESFKILVDKYGASGNGISYDELLQAREKIAAEARAFTGGDGQKLLDSDEGHAGFAYLKMEWDEILPPPGQKRTGVRGQNYGGRTEEESKKHEENNRKMLAFIFKFADEDSNGKLSRDEFREFHTPDAPDWHEKFLVYASKSDITELDADGDGKLSFKEYASKNTVPKMMTRESQMDGSVDEGRFTRFMDKNKDGFATLEEMVAARAHVTPVSQQVGDIIDAPHFDGDGDGHLSREEFEQNVSDLGFLLHQEL